MFLSAWIQLAYCAVLVGIVLSLRYDHLLCITLSAVLVLALTIQVVRLVCSIKHDKLGRKQLIKDNQSYYAFMVAYVVSLVVVFRLSFLTYNVPLETFKTSWDVLFDDDTYSELPIDIPAERVWGCIFNGVTLPEKNEKLSKSILFMWLVTGLFGYCLKKPEIYLSRRSNESEDVQ